MEAQTNNLFDNFEDLEQAYLNDHISLDMYINEYNRLIKIESERMKKADPLRIKRGVHGVESIR